LDKYYFTTLPNGTRIVSEFIPYVKSFSIGFWFNVGARDENSRNNGISHFIEHMIFKGTRKRSAYQIAKEFDVIGGHTNAFTAMENTCYHAKVIDSQMEIMVDILSDIFINSVFDPLEVDKERPVILQEIGMVEDSPDEYVHVLSGNNFWGDNPLGRSIMGSPENIIRFDDQMIKNFFYRLYLPDRIVIAAAGNLDHQNLVDLVGPEFEAIQPGNGFSERVTPQGRTLVDIRQRDLEQVHICLTTGGLSITDPRRYAFSLLNTILGGNMSSRLFQEVRERRGLAYSVYSFVSSHVDTGLFGVYIGVNPQRILETIEVVLGEIHKLKTSRVDAVELQRAIEYTKGNLLLASESTDNQMVRTAQNEIHFENDISLQSVIEKLESVSENDILELAETIFNGRELVLTLLGPVDIDKRVIEEIAFQ